MKLSTSILISVAWAPCAMARLGGGSDDNNNNMETGNVALLLPEMADGLCAQQVYTTIFASEDCSASNITQDASKQWLYDDVSRQIRNMGNQMCLEHNHKIGMMKNDKDKDWNHPFMTLKPCDESKLGQQFHYDTTRAMGKSKTATQATRDYGAGGTLVTYLNDNTQSNNHEALTVYLKQSCKGDTGKCHYFFATRPTTKGTVPAEERIHLFTPPANEEPMPELQG